MAADVAAVSAPHLAPPSEPSDAAANAQSSVGAAAAAREDAPPTPVLATHAPHGFPKPPSAYAVTTPADAPPATTSGVRSFRRGSRDAGGSFAAAPSLGGGRFTSAKANGHTSGGWGGGWGGRVARRVRASTGAGVSAFNASPKVTLATAGAYVDHGLVRRDPEGVTLFPGHDHMPGHTVPRGDWGEPLGAGGAYGRAQAHPYAHAYATDPDSEYPRPRPQCPFHARLVNVKYVQVLPGGAAGAGVGAGVRGAGLAVPGRLGSPGKRSRAGRDVGGGLAGGDAHARARAAARDVEDVTPLNPTVTVMTFNGADEDEVREVRVVIFNEDPWLHYSIAIDEAAFARLRGGVGLPDVKGLQTLAPGLVSRLRACNETPHTHALVLRRHGPGALAFELMGPGSGNAYTASPGRVGRRLQLTVHLPLAESDGAVQHEHAQLLAAVNAPRVRALGGGPRA